jgi:hypothetical protein
MISRFIGFKGFRGVGFIGFKRFNGVQEVGFKRFRGSRGRVQAVPEVPGFGVRRV